MEPLALVNEPKALPEHSNDGIILHDGNSYSGAPLDANDPLLPALSAEHFKNAEHSANEHDPVDSDS